MRWVVLGLLAGCSFSGPAGGGDTTCDIQTLGFGAVCAGAEQPATSLNSYRLIDTTTGEVVDANGQVQQLRCRLATFADAQVCAMWVASFNIDAEVRVIGDRPLVVIATGELRVRDGGQLLAGSGDFGAVDAPGPGANPSGCALQGAGSAGSPSDDDKVTWGGGGGGGFASVGGNGGAGRSGNAGGGARGPMVDEPSILRGGCPGGAGGLVDEAGRGGAGGGALYLTTLSGEIGNDGVISAVGGGGEGGAFIANQQEPGGGGGGSGGMVVIDGEFDGANGVIAVGGGGGGGGSEADGGGEFGVDGESGRSDGQPALGGDGGNSGTGGDGATPDQGAGDGQGQGNDDGGGGGGGGVGYVIRL